MLPVLKYRSAEKVNAGQSVRNWNFWGCENGGQMIQGLIKVGEIRRFLEADQQTLCKVEACSTSPIWRRCDIAQSSQSFERHSERIQCALMGVVQEVRDRSLGQQTTLQRVSTEGQRRVDNGGLFQESCRLNRRVSSSSLVRGCWGSAPRRQQASSSECCPSNGSAFASEQRGTRDVVLPESRCLAACGGCLA